MIYFIQCGENGPIKIGMSDDPYKRLEQLQTAHHEKLTLLWTTINYSEQELHDVFNADRIRGEWFKPDNIITHIEEDEKYTEIKCFHHEEFSVSESGSGHILIGAGFFDIDISKDGRELRVNLENDHLKVEIINQRLKKTHTYFGYKNNEEVL